MGGTKNTISNPAPDLCEPCQVHTIRGVPFETSYDHAQN